MQDLGPPSPRTKEVSLPAWPLAVHPREEQLASLFDLLSGRPAWSLNRKIHPFESQTAQDEGSTVGQKMLAPFTEGTRDRRYRTRDICGETTVNIYIVSAKKNDVRPSYTERSLPSVCLPEIMPANPSNVGRGITRYKERFPQGHVLSTNAWSSSRVLPLGVIHRSRKGAGGCGLTNELHGRTACSRSD